MSSASPRTASPPDPVVELVDVKRSFGSVHALAGLNLVVPSNRITVLLGPNGAGKTTAIRMITGALDAPQWNGAYLRPRPIPSR
jgi:multiple sugar transport system ATP-binding protein